MKTSFSIFLILTANLIYGQIKSGPMLGYNTMKEVAVWVQTEEPTKVGLKYFPLGDDENTQSTIAMSRSEKGNTVHLIATNLEPGTTYQYLLTAGDEERKGEFTTQSLWQHRSDPPNFSFVTGSCVYSNQEKYDRPGEPYGQGNKIFESIVSTKAEFMLWLGDNIYLREPDWSSRSGIYQRYTHFKSQAEIQNLWKSMHHYAIWDDHDYGPNDADRSYVNKEITLEAFKDFWSNSDYGVNGKEGITHQFSYNDLDFFLLDNRYYRSPNKSKTGKREILGEEQIDWLIEALVFSEASFKIVAIGGQLLSNAAVYENHATYAEEREKIIKRIEEEEIKNVIFLSGDRHKTELSKMILKNGNVLYDYTCSPLTSKAYDTSDEKNDFRIEGTHVSTQNFGLLNLSGSFENRVLSIKTYDSSAKLIWEQKIKRQ